MTEFHNNILYTIDCATYSFGTQPCQRKQNANAGTKKADTNGVSAIINRAPGIVRGRAYLTN